MTPWEYCRVLAILGPIFSMIVVGFVLILRSGLSRFGSPIGWKLMRENASQALVVLGGCVVGMAILHRMVGLPVAVSW
jgi:hypothetical protein